MSIDHAPTLEPDPMLAPLVRDAYETELRQRVDEGVDRALAVYFAIQSVPYRSMLQAA
jgi:hypothetical protein